MGYYNSKWRRILIILSIINLCFILFAKINKVFGSFTITNSINGEVFNISDNFIIKYPYYAFCTSSNGNNIMVICSNSPITTNATNSNDYAFFTYYNTNNTGMAYIGGSYVSIQNILNGSNLPNINTSLNSVTTNSYGAMRVFYTNHDIKNKNSGDTVIEDTSFTAPNFDNITEIENGNPDGVYISRGDYSKNDYLYFHLLQITYTVNSGNDTIYYYSDKTFALNKDSKYFRLWVSDPEDTQNLSYYSIPRSALGLDPNSSYLYVLSNSGSQISNTINILQQDISNGIYDVVQSDTTGVITSQDSTNDKIQNIDDTLNDDTVSNDTETNIEDSLNFDNQNSSLNNMNNGFFSRLTTMLSNLLGYNLSEDTSVSIPLPNSNQSIILHSKTIYDNVTGALRLIINAFWVYIFSFYMWKFINKIYIAVSTGNILDTFSSSGEAITNDML